MDGVKEGLLSTIKCLDDVGISFSGAGNNLAEASSPFVININSLNLEIYACAEHEFSIASDNSSGANPFDPLVSLDEIAD